MSGPQIEESAALRRADAEAREVTQTCFDRHVVLEAGAGTGKTSCLVHRIVAWCLGQGWDLQQMRRILAGRAPTDRDDDEAVAESVLSRVAAITFTEMAAAELAERVSTTLEKCLRGEAVEGFLAPASLESEETRKRARSLVLALDRLQTSTIHAFCRRLLSEHPIEAGIAPGFGVDADFRRSRAATEEVVWEVVHDTVAKSQTAEAATLQSSSDLRLLLERGVALAELAEALFQLSSDGIRAAQFGDDPLPAEVIGATIDALQRDLDPFLELVPSRLSPSKKHLAPAREVCEVLAQLRNRLAESASFEQRWDDCRDPAWETSLPRLAQWHKGGFNTTESTALQGVVDAALEQARSLYEKLLALRSGDPQFLRAAWRTVARLLKRVEELLHRRGIETFSALLRDARDLLVDHPGVRAELRAAFDQLLVDEFQDTDPLQCELVAALALDDRSGNEGPSLFLVGDPKQSIYGFRNADLAAYSRFVQRVMTEGGLFHRLSVNYRSVPAILGEVERVVSPVMHETADLQPAFQPLVASPKHQHLAGFSAAGRRPVEHWLSWARVETESGSALDETTARRDANTLEAAAIARDIAVLHTEEGVPYRDFALLLRATTQQDVYVQALREVGVPYVVERDKHYYRRREVLDTSSLIRTLLDPHDLLALVAFLRSPYAGVPDCALLPLWRAGFPDAMVELTEPRDEAFEELDAQIVLAHQRVQSLTTTAATIEGWQTRLCDTVRAMAECRQAARERAPQVFLQCVEDRFLPAEIEAARFLGRHRLANVQRFFGKLRDTWSEPLAPAAVLRELRRAVENTLDEEEGSPGDESLDAVRILTIHKSKGLTIPQVYVANLHQGSNARPNDRASKAREFQGRLEASLFQQPSWGWSRVVERENAIEQAERVRLLYVAATRAKERLVLAGQRSLGGTLRDPAESQSLQDLLDHRPAPLDLLRERCGECGVESDVEIVDEVGVRFSIPGAREVDEARSGPGYSASAFDRSRVIEEDRVLRSLQANAELHRRRRWIETAAEESHPLLEPRDGVHAPTARPIALWVGERMHAFLEFLDPDQDLAACIERFLDQARRRVPPELAGASEQAIAELTSLLEQWQHSRLAERWRSLYPHIVARELPLVAPPSNQAVGARTGAIDLLVRDPDDGALVVVDFKTDRVSDEAALHALAQAYSSQGKVYVQAVRSFLGEAAEVRFELWFLRCDRVLSPPLAEG